MSPGLKLPFLFLLPFLLFFQQHYCIAQQYNFEEYNVDRGLPQSQVFDIMQDSKGYLWVATFGGGVGKFDGENFTVFDKTNGLKSNIVLNVLEDHKGNIWMGSADGGLSIFDGENFRHYGKDTLGNTNAPCLFRDNKNNIWIGVVGGPLIKYNGEKFIKYGKEKGYEAKVPNDIIQDHLGNIWVATADKGLIKITDQGLKYFNRSTGFPSTYTYRLYNDSLNKLWIGTLDNGALRFNPETEEVKAYTTQNGLPENKIYSFTSSADGGLWIGTEYSGLVKLKDGEFTRYTEKNGLSNNTVICAYTDREGNQWFGTNGGGINKYTGDVFTFYKKPAIKHALSILKEANTIWIGTWGYGLTRIENGQYKTFTTKEGLKNNNVWDIKKIGDKLWLATDKGVAIMKNGEILPEDPLQGKLNGENIQARYFLEDDDESIWIVTGSKGVIRLFPDGETKWYNSQIGISNNSMSHLIKDSKGNIWFGTNKGVSKYDGEKFTNYYEEDGLADNRTTTLYEDNFGHIWVCTSNGVSIFDGESFNTISKSDGLNASYTYSIVGGKNNSVWVGTGKGLNKFNLNDKGDITSIDSYQGEEGFHALECNQNAVFKDENKHLWFGTIDGVYEYNPEADKKNKLPPPVYISGMKLFLQDTDWGKYADSVREYSLPVNLSLPFDKNHLTFNFVGLSYTSPNKVRYRYKMEGLNNSWSPPLEQNFATFSSLPPGDYTFKVSASNNDGVWSEEPAVYSFSITPPFWKTWWFYSSSGTILLFGFFAFVKLRERSLKRSREMLAEKVKERTREVVTQKEELATKNKNITDSINYAQRIQDAILPQPEALSGYAKDAFIFFLPRDIVSGDFYWFHKENNKVFVAAVDCTGHGVPGAFMSMIGNESLNRLVKEEQVHDTGRILRNLDENVVKALKQKDSDSKSTKDGMDLAFCKINYEADKPELEFSGANNPVIIVKEKELEQETPYKLMKDKGLYLYEIKGDSHPIGGYTKDKRFSTKKVKLEKGDNFYIYSDGYVDQFGGPRGKKFMKKRFKKLLLSIQDKSMKEQQSILKEKLTEWMGNEEQIDDILVIGFKV